MINQLNFTTVTATTFTGALVGDVTGNITGNITGTVTGNVTGNLTGNVTGNLTGNVTGNCSGTALTVTQAAQTAITSVGVLTGLSISGLRKLPISPVTVALAATVTLSTTVSLNVLRPTGDATIAAAVINMPLTPADGQICTVTTSAEITVVTGTISSAPVPPVSTLTAGQSVTFVYNSAGTVWLRA